MPVTHTSWFLYLLECQDGSIYTGITTNVTRRYQAHSSGRGARYTRTTGLKNLLLFFYTLAVPQPHAQNTLLKKTAA